MTTLDARVRRERRKNGRRGAGGRGEAKLHPEAVQGLAGALEGVDDVERGDGLALGVLGVGDRVADDLVGTAAAKSGFSCKLISDNNSMLLKRTKPDMAEVEERFKQWSRRRSGSG